MQIVFIAVAICGLGYFLLAKRRFDFFALGFLSSCLYFLPGFFGYASYPTDVYSISALTPLADKTYVVMSLVLGTVFLGGILYSLTLGRRFLRVNLPLPNQNKMLVAALGLGFLGAFMMAATTGEALLSPDKTEVLRGLNRWYVIASSFVTLAFILAVVQRKKLGVLLASALLVFDLFIGFRMTTALTLISMAMCFLAQRPPARFLVAHRRFIVLGTLMAAFFFGWSQLYGIFKVGYWDLVQARVVSPGTYVTGLMTSEPFVTQAILNEVIIRCYSVPVEHLLGVLTVFIPFFSEFFGMPVSFNARFQPVLFPDQMKYGMASNFWAEATAVGDYAVLLIYILFYVAGLCAGSILIRSSNRQVATVSAIVFSYFAFYIHRNDLAYQLLLERRILFAFLAAAMLAALVPSAVLRRKRANQSVPNP